WGGLTRYGSADTEVPAPKPGEDRVIFLGDDITDYWGQGGEAWEKYFPGKPYFNRGIARQTTPQMLVRFRQDVISLKPKVVVIQGGMNDIAAFTGPGTQGMIVENIESMVDLARFNGIKVVLASLLPVCDDCDTGKQSALRPRGKIFGLNDWLEEYAEKTGSVYLNYYRALADGRSFNKDLTRDGVLPNEAGYAVMAPLAEAAIQKALH
ncbi:MAG: SGNH/GDSL hydrolase family protein, partial [Chrysiogenetes bacterium]|nr:SGNH/GDSL hydrolase family protein [Chrysiogenetes bacterium]